MKRIFIGIAAVASLLATSAFAADLAPRTYTKAPPSCRSRYTTGRASIPAATAATAGAALATAKRFQISAPGCRCSRTRRRNDVNGVLGGGQIGYNWQVDRIGCSASKPTSNGTGERGIELELRLRWPCAGRRRPTIQLRDLDPEAANWFGTFRGRAGFLADAEPASVRDRRSGGRRSARRQRHDVHWTPDGGTAFRPRSPSPATASVDAGQAGRSARGVEGEIQQETGRRSSNICTWTSAP